MFLAFNEIKQSKLRYGLIISLLFLISYLVFFLAGLANGLAQLNRSSIDIWEADTVLLAKDATQSLNLSSIEREVADQVEADQLAYFSVLPVVMWIGEDPAEEDKIKTSLFALDLESFAAPKVLQGRQIEEDEEALISQRLAEEEGIQIGDVVELAKRDTQLTVVGITGEASYNVSPVVYTSLETYGQLLGESNPQAKNLLNAVLVKGKLESYPKNDLESLSITDFIANIPGYSAQVMTFGFMIGFLVLISTIVIAIFMYVFTMQKTQIFGVMKTQGVPTSYIGRSILIQTALLVGLGVSLGLFATWLSALALPAKVPFQIDWGFVSLVSLVLIVFSMLGSLFSVKVVASIDPLKTID